MSLLQPDLEQAQRFINLTAPGEDITFQTFDDTNAKRSSLANVFHGFLDEYAEILTKLNQQGAGIFFMVNEGDGKLHPGRKTCRTNSNVIKVRSLFVDLDGAPLEPVTSHQEPPRIVVESSPGKWHAYWPIEDCTLDQFKPAQRRLSLQFNGDKAVCDLARVMRIPGFFHQKGEPFMTGLVFPGEK